MNKEDDIKFLVEKVKQGDKRYIEPLVYAVGRSEARSLISGVEPCANHDWKLKHQPHPFIIIESCKHCEETRVINTVETEE